jgi:hypothetical protein
MPRRDRTKTLCFMKMRRDGDESTRGRIARRRRETRMPLPEARQRHRRVAPTRRELAMRQPRITKTQPAILGRNPDLEKTTEVTTKTRPRPRNATTHDKRAPS